MDKQNSNAYFEQQVAKMYSGLREEQLAQRISDCQMVVDKLKDDPIWRLVIGDAAQWVKQLDANWQEIKDESQLNAARVLKYAYLHITSLPIKYAEDLQRAKAELSRRNNVSEAVIKDYDLETNMEKK